MVCVVNGEALFDDFVRGSLLFLWDAEICIYKSINIFCAKNLHKKYFVI